MSDANEAGKRDRPWMMRTYAGHSSASASNALFRTNLAKGQTGLSVAFDLPTQTGYDPDSPMAAGEVGKVGVPIAHLGDMRTLFRDIPLDQMNTSMTINATAMWLFALYIAVAEEQGVEPAQLQGTTQNDIVKEYLSRGTYVFPPDPSLRLITDMIVYSVTEVPQWNPINICSYHLQEAGATPTQEVAYALATAIEVLDRVRDTDRVPGGDFGSVVSRMSFFVNAGRQCLLVAALPRPKLAWMQHTRKLEKLARISVPMPVQRKTPCPRAKIRDKHRCSFPSVSAANTKAAIHFFPC